MNLRQLKAFLTVCRLGNITRAAQALYVSQPALTRQIQELESLCGCALFERTKRGILLTEAGELLQIRAQEILDLAERTQHELRDVTGFSAGIVRIGCVESAAAAELTGLLKDWRTELPQAQFEIYAADGDDIRKLLDEERLDMGILLEPVETAKYDSLPMHAAERWGVVVKKDAGEAGPLDLETLSAMPLILPRRHIVIETLSQWFGDYAKSLRIAGYHNLPTLGLQAVREGIGALLCVEGSIAIRPQEDLVFRPLLPERRTGHRLVRKKNRKLSRTAERFWSFAVERLAVPVPDGAEAR